MNDEVTAGILAGGASTRFGTDKALFLWRGKPLAAHAVEALGPEVAEILLVTKTPDRFQALADLGVRVVSDGRPETNPFWGLMAALGALRTPWLFLCSCDVPLVRPALVRALYEARKNAWAVVPRWGGAEQPMAALYHRKCLEAARVLAAEDPNAAPRRLLRAVETCRLSEAEVRLVDPEGLSFLDADSIEDLRALERFAPPFHSP